MVTKDAQVDLGLRPLSGELMNRTENHRCLLFTGKSYAIKISPFATLLCKFSDAKDCSRCISLLLWEGLNGSIVVAHKVIKPYNLNQYQLTTDQQYWGFPSPSLSGVTVVFAIFPPSIHTYLLSTFLVVVTIYILLWIWNLLKYNCS